jgi:hypothetical protein
MSIQQLQQQVAWAMGYSGGEDPPLGCRRKFFFRFLKLFF